MVHMTAALPALTFTPEFGLGALLLVVVAVLLLRWPEIGTLVTLALVYLNLPAVAVRIHGVPSYAVLGAGILVVPALFQAITTGRRVVFDPPLMLMLLFLGLLVVTSFLAQDPDLALAWVQVYFFEGVLLYFLVINLVRDAATLRRAIWTLLVCGALLASLTLYQEYTGSYSNEFGGLAQRTLERETAADALREGLDPGNRQVRIAHRAQGPIDDPNRYAQILVVLLPLGWFLMRDQRRFPGKSAALAFSGLILGAVLLTYSRGAFLGLVVMVGLMVMLRFVKLYQVLIAAIVLIVSLHLVAPGYANRMLTLRGLPGLFTGASEFEPDRVQRGRATEMLAAWHVFLDHPLLGVGPGQFTPLYSISYMSDYYALRRIREQRRAHSLYLELAAETGAVGFLLFGAILIATLRRLGRIRRRYRDQHPELANLAGAFVIAITVYLTTALFLQLSFQRYFWLLLALAAATVKIARSLESTAGAEEPAGELPEPAAARAAAAR
jgi:O-antigen ligase/polysaccharide polymerase Wzy-like membrane protein